MSLCMHVVRLASNRPPFRGMRWLGLLLALLAVVGPTQAQTPRPDAGLSLQLGPAERTPARRVG